MGDRQRQKCRPWRRLRAGGTRAKIFFGNLERGKKDGHFGAHERGDKRVLTERSGSRGFEKQRGRAWSTGLGTAPDDLGLLDDEDLLICGLGLSEYVTATSSREKTNECRKNRQQSFFVTL